MPLRDHFRPPLADRRRWEGFLAGWPTMIVVGFVGAPEPSASDEAAALYADTMRSTKTDANWLIESWTQPLTIGEPLPTLPLWLADDLAVPVDLESSYEETCRVLRLP